MLKINSFLDIKLIVLYLMICLALVIRVSVESTGYISPDSTFYLEVSQNILDGKGPYMENIYELLNNTPIKKQVPYTAWPLGYPVLITIVASLSGLNVFWASKVVNLLSLGLIMLLLRLYAPRASFLASLSLCSFAMLENFSYTWSEGTFLMTMLFFCVALDRHLACHTRNTAFVVVVSTVAMFLVRYVGFIGFVFTGLLGLYYAFLRKNVQQARSLFLISLLSAFICSTYFLINYLNTGSPWGGTRIKLDVETGTQIEMQFCKALFNVFFVFRHYYFQFPMDWLFIVLGAIQFIVLGWAFKKFMYKKIMFRFSPKDFLSKLLFAFGFLYLAILLLLKMVSPFNAFDYRLFAPFTFLLYLATLIYLSNPERNIDFKKFEHYMAMLFIASLLWNLPKEYLWNMLIGLK
jgi:hypothetical protein